MNICSGSEASTGWGFVGPKTRNAIAQSCGTNTPPPPTNNLSCQTPWGTTIQSNTSVTAYQSPTVPAGQQCQSQTRLCSNGNLSGSYQYQTCQVQTTTTTSCTPEAPQTQTLSCPTGQTGSITQTRISTCPGPMWGPWTTTSNTCTTTTASTQPPTVSLTINGQSSATLPPSTTFTVAWSSSNATSCSLTNAQGGVTSITPNTTGSNQGGAPSAGTTYSYSFSCTNSGGTTTKSASVTGATGGGGGTGSLNATPTSGAAPLTVTFTLPSNNGLFSMYLYFGDGPDSRAYIVPAASRTVTHGYSAPGTYQARLYDMAPTGEPSTLRGEVTITVTPFVASASSSCTYKGQTYAEGQSVVAPSPYAGSVTCDNGAWVFGGTLAGLGVCNNSQSYPAVADYGCVYPPNTNTTAYLAVTPRHGSAPLTVSVGHQWPGNNTCTPFTINWGDGKTDNFSSPSSCEGNRPSHTYSSVGSYLLTISRTITIPLTNSANIRVDAAGTTLVPQSSQLANALTALQSALQAILKLLGQ